LTNGTLKEPEHYIKIAAGDSERILIGHLEGFNPGLVYSFNETVMRILLVEDEKKVADIIERGLKAERICRGRVP
jgi:hypothetical protein